MELYEVKDSIVDKWQSSRGREYAMKEKDLEGVCEWNMYCYGISIESRDCSSSFPLSPYRIFAGAALCVCAMN